MKEVNNCQILKIDKNSSSKLQKYQGLITHMIAFFYEKEARYVIHKNKTFGMYRI